MLALTLLALSPQVTITPRPILGSIQDAGVYDCSTGTLLPPGTLHSVGPDSIYDNTAAPDYYVGATSFTSVANASLLLTDVGGIPGPGNTGSFAAPANRAEVLVNGFEFAYCDENTGGTTGFAFSFSSGSLASTGNPVGNTAYVYVDGLPTGGTYRVLVDLGPNLSFCFRPDGGPQNPGFDGVPALDRFTVSVIAGISGGVPRGLVLAGDPGATDVSFSPPAQPLPRDGDGTYFGTAPSCAIGTTGYLTEDSMQAIVNGGSVFSGAFDTGGYSNVGGCGTTASAPWTSLYLRLFTDSALTCAIDCSSLPPEGLLYRYCASNPNSTGMNGVLSLCGPTRMWELDQFTLSASQLPQDAFGYFLHSQIQGFVANPGGSAGNLCLGANVGRFTAPGQIQTSGSSGSFSLDSSMGQWSVLQLPTANGSLTTFAGATSNFQAWYRDTGPGGTPTTNFTDGYAVLWGFFR